MNLLTAAVEQEVRGRKGHRQKARWCGEAGTPKKNPHLLLQRNPKQIFQEKPLFLLNVHEKVPNIRALNIIFSKFCYCFTLPGNSASRGSWPFCPGTQQAPGSSHFSQSSQCAILPLDFSDLPNSIIHFSKHELAKAMLFSPKFLKYTIILEFSTLGPPKISASPYLAHRFAHLTFSPKIQKWL